MISSPYNYREIFNIEDGEIYYSSSNNEGVEGNAELFKNVEENYRILAELDSTDGKSLVIKLILEAYFTPGNTLFALHRKAIEKIDLYFDKFRFLTEKYSATASPTGEVEYEGVRTSLMIGGIKLGGSIMQQRALSEPHCRHLELAKDNLIDEYIKRYNLTIQFTDAVLRLISLYGIAELIAYEKGIKKDKVNDFVSQHLQIDSLVRCTRHLVAHGVVVDQKNTLPELIEALSLNSELAFIKFRREDIKQMNLVEDSANKVAAKLKQYLESQLLKG